MCHLVLLGTFIVPLAPSLPAQNPRNVLVLHDGNANYPANILFSAVLHRTFVPETQYQVFEDYVDEPRLNGSEEQLADIFAKKYAGKKMDLVITEGRFALRFFLDWGARLWPGTPEVFDFVQARELPSQLPANMTGVDFTMDFGATVDLALRLMPDTRRVVYIGATRSDEESWRGFAEQDFKRFAGRLKFEYLDRISLSALLGHVAQLPPHTIVLYGGMYQDASGQTFAPARLCPLIASASAAPIYGVSSTYMGCGIVGGAVIDFDTLANRTSRLALRVLERGAVEGMPIEHAGPLAVTVDWRQLQRWRIPAATLPTGTIIRYRTPSVWERYNRQIISVVVTMLMLLGVIAALLIERRKRKRSDAMVRQLSGRLINASEEERRRIARELHDDVLQRLSLVSSELAAMEADPAVSDWTARHSAHEQVREVNEVISALRHLSHQLHSNKLELLGLRVALRDLCGQLSTQSNLPVQLRADDVPAPLSRDQSLCFYRVAQEALSNALKHSNASRVDVRLAFDRGALRMIVRDDGTGFDPTQPATGLGLATMRERLRLVGGSLVVRSRPGGGTEVTAEMKLDRASGETTAA